MIRVWSDQKRAGVLDRFGRRGSIFAYDARAEAERAVSLTMPVRLASWDSQSGLAPIFEMNLPEGALRERLTRRFAKATGSFDDLDLLSVVGRTQIGRMRFSGLDEDLTEDVPFQSIDEILRARRGGKLFDYLLDAFAAHSGLSGIQPKVLIRADGPNRPDKNSGRESSAVRSATHIVKLWNPEEYPELAANEFFCLEVARRAGLTVPHYELSDDGGALVVERFDLEDGDYLGFEDFCVLNGFGTSDKYRGGYETRLFKRLENFAGPNEFARSGRHLFRLFVLNCAVRNGDAHLKNFGILYRNVLGDAVLAPVFDVVTTTAYEPSDLMALTLEGSTNWPNAAKLKHLGQSRLQLSAKEVEADFQNTADALAETLRGLKVYFKESEFPEVGKRMAVAWEEGVNESLGGGKESVQTNRPGQIDSVPSRSRGLARSDSLIVESLRARGGTFAGPQRVLAEELQIPLSTVSAAVRRLAGRKLLRREGKQLQLA
jgi:serine/threonine-protein kinase HipA